MKEKYNKFKKSLGHFWEYYKWYAIVPILIIIIIVSCISSYLENTRPISLSVALVNTNYATTALASFQYDYTLEKGIDVDKEPVKVNTNLVHPSEINEDTLRDDGMIGNIQRLQAMMQTEQVDVFIGTDWVLKDYEKSDVFVDLRDIFSEEYLEEHKENICYIPDSQENPLPIAMYLPKCKYLEEFHEQAVPVIAIPKNGQRRERAIDFMEWVIAGCE